MSNIANKNDAMLAYLMTMPYIKEHPVYFNFGVIEDNNKQLIAQSVDASLNKHYVDGSELRRYSVTIVDFKSVGYNAIVSGKNDENIADLSESQQIIDWINEQNDIQNYPDFGEECSIESISVTKNTPALDRVDTSKTPAIAEYSITINVDYLDTSKVIWGTD